MLKADKVNSTDWIPYYSTLWVMRCNPMAKVLGLVLAIGTFFGLYVVFSHAVIHGHGKLPLIAWSWCLPGLIVLMLINVKFEFRERTLAYYWRFAGIRLHPVLEHPYQTLTWVDLAGKGKTFVLGYKEGNFRHILTLNAPAARRLSFFFIIEEKRLSRAQLPVIQ